VNGCPNFDHTKSFVGKCACRWNPFLRMTFPFWLDIITGY
jgi:hypothetical protein